MTLGMTKPATKTLLIAVSSALVMAGTAMAQSTRSSATASDPLYAIANGIDPVTGQVATVPFTAPTTFGANSSSASAFGSPSNAQPIFISDAELMGSTDGFGAISDFNAVQPTIVTQSLAPNGQPVFVSDAELGSSDGFFIDDASITQETLTEADGFVGRTSGNLPIVGPEYANEIPGMGLSVVSPIQTVSSQQAAQIIADIAAGNGSTTGLNGSGSDVPADLPLPNARPASGLPYISGKLAYVRLGKAEVANPNPLASPNPVSPVTPSTSTDNLNAPIQDGQPATFSTLSGATPAPAPAAEAEVAPTPAPEPEAAPVAEAQPSEAAEADPAPSPAPVAPAENCVGPLIIQFSDAAKEIDGTHKARLKTLIDACRSERPGTVYSVAAYPDAAWAGDASARSIPGARLFSLRFFMVESGVSSQDLELRPEQATAEFSNALVVRVD